MEYVVELTKKDYRKDRIAEIFSKISINPDTMIVIRFKDFVSLIDFHNVFDWATYNVSDKLEEGLTYKMKIENIPDDVRKASKNKAYQRTIKNTTGGIFYSYISSDLTVNMKLIHRGTPKKACLIGDRDSIMFFPLKADRINLFAMDVSRGCDIEGILKSIMMSAIVQHTGHEEFKIDVWLKTKRIDGDWNYTQSVVLTHPYFIRKFKPNVVRLTITFDTHSIKSILDKSTCNIEEINELLTDEATPTVQLLTAIRGDKILNMIAPNSETLTEYGSAIVKHLGTFGITKEVINEYLAQGQKPTKITTFKDAIGDNMKTVKQYDLNGNMMFSNSIKALVKKEEAKEQHGEQRKILDSEPMKTEPKDSMCSEKKDKKNDIKDSRALSHDAIDLIYDIDEMIRAISELDENVLSLAINMVESLNLSSNKSSLIKFIMTYAKNKKKKEA